jgi:hypothetical protein
MPAPDQSIAFEWANRRGKADMGTNIGIPPDHAIASFVRGGPFYRIQESLGMIRPGHWNLGRRIGVLVAIGYVPLLLITAISNPSGLHSLLIDYRVYARMLVAVPALIFGELLLETRFRTVMEHIRRAGLLDAPDMEHLDKVIASLLRVRDALLPELAVLVLLVVTATSYKGLIDATPWLTHRVGTDLQLTTAGWYAVLVTAPLFQFLLGLGLWKWLLWTFFAFKLSKRNLRLIPTHPDEHGGIGFLGLTASAFAPVAFAAASVIGATWRHEMIYHGARLMEFRLPTVALIAIIGIFALGPLIFFVPRPAALRRRGILEYGVLAQAHSAEFHEKWVVHRAGHESEFLLAPESTTLANFGNVYEKIEQMKPFPGDKGSLYALAAAIAVPALPVILAQIPVAVVLTGLFKALR